MAMRKEKLKMYTLKNRICLRCIKFLNVVLMVLPFAYCWQFYYMVRMRYPFQGIGNWIILLVFCVFYSLFGRIYEAFLVSLHRISEMIYSQSLSAVMADILIYIVMILLYRCLPNPLPLIFGFAAQVFISIIWGWAAHKWYFHYFSEKQTVIIYGERRDIKDLINNCELNAKFHIQRIVGVKECMDLELGLLKEAEAVFLCGIPSHERNRIIKYCVANHICVYVIPYIGDLLMSEASPMHMFHLPIMRVDGYSPTPEYLLVKRFMDIVLSCIALILLAPVFLITTIAIKIEDGGPVFYKQCRWTKDRKTFEIIKFRSMRVDAEKDGIARLSSGKSDDRITKVGKYIRRLRIDELPQFINILCGELTIVGPRPERPEIAAQYESELPEFSLRLQAKAGLTGLAQVYGKYNTTPYDKLQMDLMYMAHPGILNDLKIIFATIKILFMPESTEGFEDG